MTVSSDLDLSPELPAGYTVERQVGRGGMGTVYAARDAKHGRSVALKVLRAELAETLGAERFRREITLAASLQHPHIVAVYDSGVTTSGVLWFTMPLVEGESLRARLRQQHQLPVQEAVRITHEIALALDYAHRHGVIHRDIKPENILLADGQAMVADFGIARASTSNTPEDTLTSTGVAIGTPAYMSPEQAAGKRAITPATDVYSLGLVLYEMLAGERPCTGVGAELLAAKVTGEELRAVRGKRPDVPPSIDAVIRKSLALAPADRYGTAAEFAAALESDAPILERSSSRRRRTALVGGVVLAAMAISAWAYEWRAQSSGAAAAPMLAVLPFENEGDSTNSAFVNGITEEVRGKLSAVPGLLVIGTASSNRYRHTAESPEQIARELGVHYLLTGSVAWAQDASGTRRVRVSPELVEIGSSGPSATKWHQSFDTTLADVFAVQSSVATQVAERLGVVLSPFAQTQLAAKPTKNIASYEAYLRSARLFSGDPASMHQALAAAEKAIALDSEYAAPWALICTLHAYLYNWAGTVDDSAASARAADRLIALAPTSPVGYEARGDYEEYVRRDSSAALAEYRKAVQFAPYSSPALQDLGWEEEQHGQLDSAIAHFRRAEALDPRSVALAFQLAWHFLDVHQWAEARAQATRGLSSSPDDLNLNDLLVESYLGEGDLHGAQTALRTVPPTLDRGTFVAYIATWHDLYWIFDDADRALLLTTAPSAFDNSKGLWAMVRAEVYWAHGDARLARAWADSARRGYETDSLTGHFPANSHPYYGVALAYLGQKQSALREVEWTRVIYRPEQIARKMIARTYLALGDSTRALAELEAIVTMGSMVSPGSIRIDPDFVSLRGNARFERVVADSAVPSRTGR